MCIVGLTQKFLYVLKVPSASRSEKCAAAVLLDLGNTSVSSTARSLTLRLIDKLWKVLILRTSTLNNSFDLHTMSDKGISTSHSGHLTPIQHSHALTMQESESPFLRLPLETRRLIYQDLLVADAVSIALRPNEWNIHVNILRTCKNIYLAAREVLENMNCFVQLFASNQYNLLREMGAKGSRDVFYADMKNNFPPITMLVGLDSVNPQSRFPLSGNECGILTMAHMTKLADVLTIMSLREPGGKQLQILPLNLIPRSRHYQTHLLDILSQIRGLRNTLTRMYPTHSLIEVSKQIQDFDAMVKQPLRTNDLRVRVLEHRKAYLECSSDRCLTEGLRRRERVLYAKQAYDYVVSVMGCLDWSIPYPHVYRTMRNLCTAMIFSIIRTSRSLHDWRTVSDMVALLRKPDLSPGSVGPNRMAMFEAKNVDILDLYRTFERDDSILSLELPQISA